VIPSSFDWQYSRAMQRTEEPPHSMCLLLNNQFSGMSVDIATGASEYVIPKRSSNSASCFLG
jgi:hypothetical protein